ncbi:MAG: GreA/GreB family elongation factor [Alphaproteobacteria bacterium]|nr:GreA/GreB family elongation factor [Alphaproteobacteria bacterium]
MDHETLQSTTLPDIKITKRDIARLERLLQEHSPIRSWKAVAFLTGEMDRATIIADEEADPTLVTIGARAAFRDDDRNETNVATLTLPGTRALYADAISILTPVGAALIGLSVGQSMTYAAPDGRVKTITVTSVLHQPQAARTQAKPGAQFLGELPVPTD